MPDTTRRPAAAATTGGPRALRVVREAFTARLPYKAAALFVSLALWLVVSSDQPSSSWVTVRVAPLIDGSLRLAGPAPLVRARVSGPARELMLLTTQPPVVRRPVAADAPDTLRMELVPEDVELPGTAGRVRVRDVRPRVVVLRLVRTDAPARRTVGRAR